MSSRLWKDSFTLLLFAAAALIAGGCGKTENKGDQSKEGPEKDKPTQVAEKKKDDHSGWWCEEHGIPEELCSMCGAKVAADFKKKGDWCEEHDRAKSQCFKCDPKLKEKFAAQY